MPFDNTNLDDATRLLLDARSYIERGWCRGFIALAGDGSPVDATDKRAAQWCLYGALLAAGMRAVRNDPAIVRLQRAAGANNLVDFNNSQKDSAPVLAAFDRAIVN